MKLSTAINNDVDHVSHQSNAFSDALAKAITARREGLKLSKYELSIRSGLSAGHVGYIEQRKRLPTVDSLKRIAIGLGTTVESLAHEAESACPS